MVKIPSQMGEWKIERECGRWFATHSDWERGDIGGGESGPAHAGGPVHAEGATVVDVIVGLIEIEAQGDDFMAFCAAVETAASGIVTDGIEAEELTGELLRLAGYHAVEGVERITEALEDGMLGLGREDARTDALEGFSYSPEALQIQAMGESPLPMTDGEYQSMIEEREDAAELAADRYAAELEDALESREDARREQEEDWAIGDAVRCELENDGPRRSRR